MTEREEKIIKKSEEKKPSLWQRMKKPLAAGLLGASLLFSPAKKADAVGFAFARYPPYYASEIIEKKYPTGWKLLVKVRKHQRGEIDIDDSVGIKLNQSAINYFKKKYEETKDPDALYLWVFSIYSLAGYEQTFEKTEERCMEALKLIDERLKEKPDFDFIDLKLMIYYNLAVMYYEGHIKHPDYIRWGHIDFSKLDFYERKSIEFCIKYKEYLEEVKERWNKVNKYIFRDLNYTEEDVIPVKEDFMNGFIKRGKELESILSKLKD